MPIPSHKKTWEIINSNLFIWLLCLVFLGFSPFIWNQWKVHEEKEKLIDQIDSEIWSRFNQLVNICSREADSAKLEYLKDQPQCVLSVDTCLLNLKGLVNVKEILFAFLKPPSQTVSPKFYPLYQQFDSNSFISLLSQLILLESDRVKRESIRKTLVAIEAYKNIPLRPVPMSEVNTVINRFKNPLFMQRWNK